MEKQKVPDCDYDRLKQDQPTHESPSSFRLGILHAQSWLQHNDICDHISCLLTTKAPLLLKLLDRFVSLAA